MPGKISTATINASSKNLLCWPIFLNSIPPFTAFGLFALLGNPLRIAFQHAHYAGKVGNCMSVMWPFFVDQIAAFCLASIVHGICQSVRWPYLWLLSYFFLLQIEGYQKLRKELSITATSSGSGQPPELAPSLPPYCGFPYLKPGIPTTRGKSRLVQGSVCQGKRPIERPTASLIPPFSTL